MRFSNPRIIAILPLIVTFFVFVLLSNDFMFAKAESMENYRCLNDENLSQIIINVMEQGAIADGSADDTEAIKQSFVCAKQLLDQGIEVSVYFPAGNYVLKQPIIIDSINNNFNELRITGDGPGTSRISTALSTPELPVFTFKNLSNNGKVYISDLHFSSLKSSSKLFDISYSILGTSSGVSIDKSVLKVDSVIIVPDFKVNDVSLDFYSTYFNVTGVNDVSFTNILMTGGDVRSRNTSFTTKPQVEQCISLNNINNFIIMDSFCQEVKNAVVVNNGKGSFSIDGFATSGSEKGITINGPMSGNLRHYHTNSSVYGARFFGLSDLLITNSTIYNTTSKGTYSDLILENVSSSTISNIIFGFESPSTRYGIYLMGTTKNVNILNNYFDQVSVAVVTRATIRNILFKENVMSGVKDESGGYGISYVTSLNNFKI